VTVAESGPPAAERGGRISDLRIQEGRKMKPLAFAAGLVLIGATAHAATATVDGAAIRSRDACRSNACVAVYAPGYGAHADKTSKHPMKIARVQKDQSRFVSTETAPARAHPETTPPGR